MADDGRPDPRRWLVALPLASLLACAIPLAWTEREGCPVVPVASSALPSDANLRVRMEMRTGKHRIGLEVVARLQDDALVVVGLAPHGAVLFSLQQRERSLDIETGASSRGRHLALWVLDVLNRVYWIEPSPPGRLGAGTIDFVWDGERVRESWHGGWRHRDFSRADRGPSAPGVTIDYPPARASNAREPITIRNDWCGYEAVVAALDEESVRRGQADP